MDSQRKSKIELTTSAEDWDVIRECYVKSFFRYPLYKYMVPDPTIREQFLRAYLDANYEVTVGSGQGILLAIKVLNESEDETQGDYKVVGGVVFVPPSSDGNGWAVGDDEPYWRAYKKHKLEEISKDGLARVKRYESWENDHVAQKMSGARIPLWNGLFCAIEPEFASKGVGSAVYKEAIRIMAKYWVKQQNATKPKEVIKPKAPEKQEDQGLLSKILRTASFALLHHRAIPSASILNKACEKKTENKEKKSNQPKPVSVKDMMFNPKAPLVVAVSHSDRAANFHQSNGFHPVSRLPYYDEVEKTTPFFTHVLVLDPFSTGKINDVEMALQEDTKEVNASYENNFSENINRLRNMSTLS